MEDIAKEVDEEEIAEIHTPCLNCAFADCVDIDDVPTQVGCKVGQLDLYREKGSKIIEASDNKQDFFIINGKICPKRRSEKWKYYRSPLSKQIEEVNKEVIPGFDVVIYLDKNSTLEQLENTLHSLNTLNYPTGLDKLKLVIINNFSKIKTGQIVGLITSIVEIPWVVENITEKDCSVYRAVDISYLKYKKQFYSVFEAGYKIPQDFFHNIDKAINEELTQCCVVRPDGEINGLTVLNSLHKILVGNRNGTIIEKIEALELTDKGVFKATELTLT